MSGLSIILRSDKYEDAHYALAMASAALAVNQSAVLFFTMGGLRAAGYLTSVRGHGGGWALARPLDTISLRDIHEALGSPKLLAIGLADDEPKCLIEQAVNEALRDAMAEAEHRLLTRFGEVTIGALSRNVALPPSERGRPETRPSG